jgi:SAM-dependent methyltransferase
MSTGTILRTGIGYWASRTLMSAIELGVFTELGRSTKDLAQLSSALGLHERGARDFLDALVALGLLTRDETGYANTRETRMFLDASRPTYVGGSFAMSGPRLWRAWAGLTDALRTGRAQYEGADGTDDLFGALYAEPENRDRFLRSMAGSAMGIAAALARVFPWKDHTSAADIGCALGTVPIQIARAHPHLRVIGFDLPAVREPFEAEVARFGLGDRVTFRGGDFFTDALPPADVLVLGHVLHDWDLDQKQALLARAHDALPPGGVLLIYEALIDDERRHHDVALLMSLNMLVDTPGGFNFTAAEVTGWLAAAGFSECSIEPLVEPDSLVIARR